MREFFKQQLKMLHITTGLQQYFKIQEMPGGKQQIKLLLDELEQVCTWFPLIPENDKKKIISDSILLDPEFIGFNKKIILKWLNVHNQRYIQATAYDNGRTEIDESKLATPEQVEQFTKDWLAALSKIGNIQPRADGIKDQRIQQLKDNFGKMKCIHPNWIYSGENEQRCNDCGITRIVESFGSEPEKAEKQ